MLKQKLHSLNYSFKIAAAGVLSLLLVSATVGLVRADQFDQQIQQLQEINTSNRAAASDLAAQASSYQDAINKLDQQVNALQQSIVDNQLKSQDLQKQIDQAQLDLDHQKQVLGENIKAMYLEGQVSTLEVLASSNNISDFVNKQEYRNSVQSKVKTSLDKINALKVQLTEQQRALEAATLALKAQRTELSNTQSHQAQMLAYTQGQKAAFDSQVSSNNSKIAELRRQQIIANSRNVIGVTSYGGSCGGGYPGTVAGPWGNWGCNYAKDNVIDNWGMYNRECVSYTAYRVAASGRNMPNWGGIGDANMWPDNARAAGIPMDYGGNARVGDVAISTAGTWGHAMYVESVNGDGTVTVSQYNQDFQGNYSVNTRSVGSLYFIHF
jgi:peptidoglycan hydrolase CwlO-like protein